MGKWPNARHPSLGARDKVIMPPTCSADNDTHALRFLKVPFLRSTYMSNPSLPYYTYG